MPGDISFIDNISVGINLNYGSVLRGGPLVLLFNEG
ncbi:Solitary outer membrane autotransporter beta-barrel domain [Marinobacter sediminum]|nr:Solitary outer membrane autotransporter beta-barrel domain [Marinobacter sediminum]